MLGGDKSSRTNSADVIIVGGGVIGLSIARELRLRGVDDVVLLEKCELGKEASWAAGGILAPQIEADCADGFFQLARASRDMYPALAAALRSETNIDVELNQTGTLYVGFTEEDEQPMRRRYEWQRREGLRVEWLTGDEACKLEPNLSSDVQCALRFPDDWQVNNRKLVEAFVASNEKLGVRLMTNCEVTSILVDGQEVTGVQSSAGSIYARTAILAAGAWTSHIGTSEPSFRPVEIEPVRGQMLCFKTQQQFARHVIYSSRGYLVPRRGGRILAGSTSERVGFEKRVTDEGMNSIKSMAFKIAPTLESFPIIDSWAGFRPRAKDDLPVLGASEEIERLFYATGHYRNGILLAPITAEVIADLIVGGVSSTRIETFSPKRFCVAHA
ncbi:MAG TPA: glycine oxidase ThiO [Pyrinomonadaceae bacterium]|jgi:glycine oxidase